MRAASTGRTAMTTLAALDRAFDTLLVEEPAPHILQVTLNRPERANAFTTQMGRELIEVF